MDTNTVLNVAGVAASQQTMHSHEYEWLSLVITFIGGGFGLKLLETWLSRHSRSMSNFGEAEVQLKSLLEAQKLLTQRNSELVLEYERRIKEVKEEFERRIWQLSVDLTTQLDKEKKRCQAETDEMKKEIQALRDALRSQLDKKHV
jgi:hypothetical protein